MGKLLKDLVRVNEQVASALQSSSPGVGGPVTPEGPVIPGVVPPVPPIPRTGTGTGSMTTAGNAPSASASALGGLPASLFLAFCQTLLVDPDLRYQQADPRPVNELES